MSRSGRRGWRPIKKLTVETLIADPFRCAVFRDDGYGNQVRDDAATNDLHAIRGKLDKALAAMPDGYVQREPLIDCWAHGRRLRDGARSWSGGEARACRCSPECRWSGARRWPSEPR